MLMRRAVSSTLQLVMIVVSLLSTVCVYRALFMFPTPPPMIPCEVTPGHVSINESTRPGMIDRFVGAIRHRTLSWEKGRYDVEQLQKLVQYIEKTYPMIHNQTFIRKESVAKYSVLYTVTGTDPSLSPYMLCSHLDVVPVEESKWTMPPFDGTIHDGWIYGRGTMDVKDTLMGMLEALEFMLTRGFRPRRGFLMAFGHDEELSGFEGAMNMAKVVQSRGHTPLLYLLDEGTMIAAESSLPGVRHQVALIGVSEKGYLDIKVTVKGDGGHSSMAPKITPIVTISKGLSKFTSDAHPSRFTLGPEKGFFEAVASYATFPYKLIYGNLWLFRFILAPLLSLNPTGNSFVRTTSAVTVISGGLKANMIPTEVTATINHRIHPFDTIASVINYDKFLFEDDNIEITVNQGFEPHPISPHGRDSFGYHVIGQSVQKVFPETIIAPSIMIASTDTKWYLDLTKNIYRFSPAVNAPADFKRIHGHDERITVDNYIKVVNFYHHLILMSDEVTFKPDPRAKDEL